MRAVALVRRYSVLAATLAVGVAALAAATLGADSLPRLMVSAFALGVAAREGLAALKAIRSGNYGVDVLAMAAIVATVAVGEYWAALVICLMLSGGEALESYAAGRARRDLSALLERAPQTAHRATPDGGVADVDVDDVAAGDEIWVLPGEVVPVDGVLLDEGGLFDESSLTGEPLPVERGRGDEVLSGSVNGSEAVLVRASATAADSQYQAIVALVREAQESKAPVVRLADRVAVPFTAAALAVAALAWWISGDPARFAEVLVVATPCPLIIAAPVAFLAGMSRAAKAGVIVKSAGTLEQLSRISTVAFDKTGTLTHGRPEVAAVLPTDGMDEDQVLRLAAAVEQYSGHPLGAAIVAAARERGLTLPPAEDGREVTAHGVTATVAGRSVVVGKAAFVAGHVDRLRTPPLPPGHTYVHVAVDGRDAGTIALADRLRAEAPATVAALRRAGVAQTMMLTGDAAPTARHIAAQVGIDDVRAGLLPQEKVEAVREAPDRPVMMVGDGVNDAPVLAAADVGVAMGARGSTAASESADVVVLLDDLFRTVRALWIGRRTVRVAWQAIGIGIGLSAALMALAASGRLPALAGAWLQEAVDLTCILWALLAARPGTGEAAAPQPSPQRTTATTAAS